jgi:multidrug efflux pump subunit AcrA (membrane-fusion protein)
MYARISITTDERKEALVVPANAVVDLGGRRGVFLANEDSTVTFRPVRVGIEEQTQIEILEGLLEGDHVVTTGAGALQDGARVIIAGKDEHTASQGVSGGEGRGQTAEARGGGGGARGGRRQGASQ